MKLIHNSRCPEHRVPFGAVVVGSVVHLTLQVEDADVSLLTAQVRLWTDEEGERLIDMDRTDANSFVAAIPCPEPQIIWYSFRVMRSDGTFAALGAQEGSTGGRGVMYDRAEVPSFQITVYRHREKRPSWYEGGIVYQIFPDRYRRDPEWRERSERVCAEKRNGPGKHLIADWSQPPVYDRNEDGSIASWDFYGGSLEGIRLDLPRLKSMGVTAIYLNPIFEAESNHRYDTADYLSIDPMLGTKDDFARLASDARKMGISLILDGVFNHTGDDSIYFNRYGNYPELGAWQSEESPWRDAFHFHEDGTYDAWWGIGNMPALNEDCDRVRELILGENGVIRTWLRAGARGWRLDVADELSDELIAGIKRAVLEECPDGLLLGEVWEDASNKVSYGKLRRYLLGDELDSAMNYPFRDAVLALLMGWESAFTVADRLESLRENYPPEALACALNLLGSHDKPRIASVLGGGPDEGSLPEEERGRFRLDENSMSLAKARFWLAVLMQMSMPGVPCIYYGDEFALEGLSDPGNRRTLPELEDIRDHDMLTMVRNASMLRRALPFLSDGSLETVALNDDVLCIKRRSVDGQLVSVLINRSLDSTRSVRVPIEGDQAVDLISGTDLARGNDGCAEVRLWPLGSSAVYSHRSERLQKPMERGAGVLCHITSLPNPKGTGALGAPARRFIDRIADAGFSYWQVLPVNPTDPLGSPYAGPSAFAGNTDLLEETPSELARSYDRFCAQDGFGSPEFLEFSRRNEVWLDPYCAFMAIKDAADGAARSTWPEELSRYDVALLADPRFAKRARYHAFLQFLFDREWSELLEYAHRRGIQIIGDIPMYVSDDSADAWSEPSMFSIDERGRAYEVAGMPPDRFSATGQVWGNPTYRWDEMRRDGYTWWLARLRRAFALYDRVRLDHFLGFHSYYAIPAGKTGAEGTWMPGPGIELFQRAYEEMGPLPLIAEDLGLITPGVRALLASCGFPGMDVVEFSDYDVREGIYPHRDKILYTSTHDTSTLAGFCHRSFCSDRDEDSANYIASMIVNRALQSDADVVMLQLQDVLYLGDEARMNVPGCVGNNWSWQADETDFDDKFARIHGLLIETARTNR